MNAQFQNLFDNVCRCFGHAPNNNSNNAETNDIVAPSPGGGDQANPNNNINNLSSPHQPIGQVNSTSSAGVRRRTNRLELKDKQWDELFEKNQRGSQQHQQSRNSYNGQHQHRYPPRPEGYGATAAAAVASSSTTTTSATDHETARAVAQAKLAANPPRYRTKRKRSAQSREEIFRSKNERGRATGSYGSGGSNYNSSSNNNHNSYGNNRTSLPQTDFSRLLNPSLALCFATPIRGTEEEPEEQDLRSVDNSDTATLNTNGEDTITSTLYFDSKYAHIQETRPPMPLFNQFKIGQSKDEIRTIMATDSHSSLKMVKIMQQQQQQQLRDQRIAANPPGPEGDDSSSSEDEDDVRGNNSNNSSRVDRRKKDPSGGHTKDQDEEMQDAVPDVKAVSSSTDSSRLSNVAHKHTA